MKKFSIRRPERAATAVFARVWDTPWRPSKDEWAERHGSPFEARRRRGAHLRMTALMICIAAAVAPAQAQSIEEKAQVCVRCHGDNGTPPQQPFPVPVIWGQQAGYLFFQLRDFKSGARKNEQMSPIAEALDRADLLPLATYFSKKPWPNLQQPPAAGDVAAQAQKVSTSVVCTSCHQEGFKGAGTQPRLAGQERAYLEKTMLDFKTSARGNNPGMTGFMKGLTDTDISALAAWLAGM